MHTYSIASWSGGKDSCFALYKAVKQGRNVKYLLNFIGRESQRGCFHGIERPLLRLQAERIGIPLIQKETTPDMAKYEEEFKEAVRSLSGASSMIFGDIYLLDHYSWVERVCNDLGIEMVEPLWNMPTEKIMEEFVDLGFKAVIVSCQADKLDKSFIGRLVDKPLIGELKKKGVCPCGENGEFHTFVFDGPIFKKKIKVLEGEPVLKEGFWKHWFLDIKRYE